MVTGAGRQGPAEKRSVVVLRRATTRDEAHTQQQKQMATHNRLPPPYCGPSTIPILSQLTRILAGKGCGLCTRFRSTSGEGDGYAACSGARNQKRRVPGVSREVLPRGSCPRMITVARGRCTQHLSLRGVHHENRVVVRSPFGRGRNG